MPNQGTTEVRDIPSSCPSISYLGPLILPMLTVYSNTLTTCTVFSLAPSKKSHPPHFMFTHSKLHCDCAPLRPNGGPTVAAYRELVDEAARLWEKERCDIWRFVVDLMLGSRPAEAPLLGIKRAGAEERIMALFEKLVDREKMREREREDQPTRLSTGRGSSGGGLSRTNSRLARTPPTSAPRRGMTSGLSRPTTPATPRTPTRTAPPRREMISGLPTPATPSVAATPASRASTMVSTGTQTDKYLSMPRGTFLQRTGRYVEEGDFLWDYQKEDEEGVLNSERLTQFFQGLITKSQDRSV